MLYGADLDTRALGSGFPTRGGRLADSPYADAPWNLNNLPGRAGDHGSLLRHLGDSVPGVTVGSPPPVTPLSPPAVPSGCRHPERPRPGARDSVREHASSRGAA